MGLAVYIHIPFCVRKCSYCDFPSYPVAGRDVAGYLKALMTEMSWYREQTAEQEVSTLYIGGGTPSILSIEQLTALFAGIGENFRLAQDAEISLEANPGTVDCAKLEAFRRLGINRLSLGVQSLNKELLHQLGRIHTPGEAVAAFELARKAGFANINLDLMHGLPGQSPGDWLETLERASALGPEHLSVYGLIIEENTPFGRAYEAGTLSLPEEELQEEMFKLTHRCLSSIGYKRYEISNYARPGRECKHNQVYWHNLSYLGFGAGAASYWQGVRRTNYLAEYAQKVSLGLSPVAEQENPDILQQMAETMFLGLRLAEGVNKEEFYQKFNFRLDEVYREQIARLVNKGLLEDEGFFVRLSERGTALGNIVFCEFLP